MKSYRIVFADGSGKGATVATIRAENEDALGSFAMLEWAAEEFGEDYADVETDGCDIWLNRDGRQEILARVVDVEQEGVW